MKRFELNSNAVGYLNLIQRGFGVDSNEVALTRLIALGKTLMELSTVDDTNERSIRLLLPDGTIQPIVLSANV